ncbi:hypothetical protein Taro_039868 [Colocasia esculenta]|uniref:AT-hook motif nuclear-localized protein n=1 Tax=Colocasia esculenta TaxID=4460 RepID=A0A843WAE3_COLES|nr:hypothetical protein [Colocasia esculenta]
MDGRESMSPGVAAATAPASEGGGSYSAAAGTRPENPSHGGTPTAAAMAAVGMVASGSAGPASATVPIFKKKRGRPRKYGADGSLLMPLNPMPISASAPAGDYPMASAAAVAAAMMKRGRGRPAGSMSQQHRVYDMESFGESISYSAGANFTPHIITVAAGEDVTMKIISFSQQGPQAICILSANGVISNVTLRQPDSSGGTLTYEGRFELLSLSGSFMPTESGGTRSRSGGMSVSLASPDGRVVGGGVAGLLVAASPVQVVVGSFMPNYQMEQKTKRVRAEPAIVSTPTAAVPISSSAMDQEYSTGQGQPSSIPKTNLTVSSSFRGENWSSSQQSVPDSRNSVADINVSLPER